MRGLDVRHISTRAIQMEIASYLYSEEVDGSQSDDLDIARAIIRNLEEKRQDHIKQVLDCLTFEEFVEGSDTHYELKTALDKLKK
jgi:hypothetical protein